MRFSDTEWTVMNEVWKDSPTSVRDVHNRLVDETSWAYSTVKTILNRLAEKGALRVGKRGNASVFEPTLSREEARRSAVRSLLDRAFDGTFGSLVHHLVDAKALSDEDRRQLRKALAETANTEPEERDR